MTRNRLRKAIERGLKDGSLGAELKKLRGYRPTLADDGHAICDGLSRLPLDIAAPKENWRSSLLHELANLFQDLPGPNAAYRVLQQRGVPELIRLFDCLSKDKKAARDLLFVLKILALYGTREGTEKVVQAARAAFHADDYMWSVILGAYARKHPQRAFLIDGLKESLSPGFLGVSLLDVANQIAIEEKDFEHPFKSRKGVALLHSWLRDPNPENFSYALSATAALPFVGTRDRNRLMAVAMDHSDTSVQLEAAWAAAKVGSARGLIALTEYCLDVSLSQKACRYLQELGRSKMIPKQALDADFQAKAEMCAWLAHPNEFGRPPDSLELVDSRVLYWPPTRNRRRLWTFKYRFAGEKGEKEDVGMGLVGSITFALFGENAPELTPEDVHALHCCWELMMNNDVRAPRKRSISAGRLLLAKDNPSNRKQKR